MSQLTSLPFVAAGDFDGLISYREAIDSLETELLTGTATEHSPLRTRTDLPGGHLLYMPSQIGHIVGVKLASVSASNQGRGLPRIQGLVIISDSETLQPIAVIDASGFTVLRTAALSALAVRHLAPENSSTLLVFGTGPQSWGHIEAIRAVRPIKSIIIVGRSPERAQKLLDRSKASGLHAELGSPGSVSQADVVACCTSATSPLFDSGLLHDNATTVAIGSHSPDSREVDSALVERAFTTVETRTSAFAEAGDIVMACNDGVKPDIAVDSELDELVANPRTQSNGLRLFKSVGEAWSDVTIASLILKKLGLHT
ncbi:ornithine cyclodeaminase [Brevibacterium aurantiacum]|uniref:Ornithine cyclodeaminase n=1 Tax=Brevibacterium aurantiacum TaxID=273384 RepID=A0A2H1KXI1_BREAU|nr:ornithine cyclodeaminase family protein [Brevibacterium aurantiacum]SMY04359.1 ornithine cyclodeaminase [Brevibacterium aurantiacum]